MLVFEKRLGKYDALLRHVDGRLEEIACPKQAPIPHDMFHFAVETVLERAGFAHRYAAGEGVGFRMSYEASAEAVERLVEAMQADCWSGRPDPAEVIALFGVTCEARGDTPFDVTVDEIIAIRAEIDRLTRLWEATPTGGRLELALPASA